MVHLGEVIPERYNQTYLVTTHSALQPDASYNRDRTLNHQNNQDIIYTIMTKCHIPTKM